jgi:Ca2+-binding RTX toxin-like protein
VTVGSKGTASTYINYFGGPDPVTKGALTWSIEADTPTTLTWITVDTATLIATNELASTSTTRYRLNADNTVTALFKTIEAYSGFTQGAGDIVINEKYE